MTASDFVTGGVKALITIPRKTTKRDQGIREIPAHFADVRSIRVHMFMLMKMVLLFPPCMLPTEGFMLKAVNYPWFIFSRYLA